MAYMRQAVVTIEEPNGHLRYTSLPVYLYSDASTVDTVDNEAIVEIARRMARVEAGQGTVIDIEWMGEEEL